MKKTFQQFEETITEVLALKDQKDSFLTNPISEGKWSIREIIGHLYYWDKFNLEEMVPHMAQAAKLREFPDHDTHNEEAISYLTGQSVESIIDLFVATRKQLTKSMLDIGEEVKFTIGKGKRQFTTESFTKIFLKHDVHHLKQINEKLQEIGAS
ncbi:DinB family protein [Ornithinibacillus sp. BX22]|uniref:DinB family protein n=2 Tax=Ornithinibacillus TaxID=484508 RepID=A0A923RHE6_9BACI|nr:MULTISPECIES: DinB family protein [Ornithinibacillus]MBC5636501.1 DinB family protein [Ornithinibacillus hominis]MBS3680657.1 DinB family protein [Ornithinibacillus massiliensis]